MLKQYSKQILLTLFLLMLVMIIVLSVAMASINQYAESVNLNRLEQVQSVIDARLQEIFNVTFQIYSSPALYRIRRVNNIFERGAIPYTIAYQNSLENFNAYNQYIFMNFSFFVSSDYVLMPRSGQDIKSFAAQFSNNIQPTDENTAPPFDTIDFINVLNRGNFSFAEKIIYTSLSGAKTELLPYVAWHTSGSRRTMAVVALLDITKINALLSQSLASDNSALCIVDGSNNIIASSRTLTPVETGDINRVWAEGAENALVDGNLTAYSRPGSAYGWRYIMLANRRESTFALNNLLFLIIIVGLTCLIIAAWMTAAVIRRSQSMLRPLMEMMDTGEYAMKRHDIHAELTQNVRRILEDRTSLNRRLHEQETVIREVYLYNLLIGDTSDFGGRMAALGTIDIYRPDAYYYVVIISVRTAAGGEVNVGRIKSVIAESVKLFSKNILSCNINRLQMALIISSAIFPEDTMRHDFLELLYTSLEHVIESDYGSYLILSVGGVHSGENAIPTSYLEAKMSLDMPPALNETIVWYQEADSRLALYYYPPEAEIRLINAIRSGNRDQTENIIRELFDINLVKRRPTHEFLTVFLHDFYGSILKMTNAGDAISPIQTEICNFYAANIGNISSAEFQQKFLAYILALTDSFYADKKSHHSRLIENIKQFVRQNFADYDLTLYRVADEFNLSGGYLSTFFKEQTGITFSEYMLGVRMEQAQAMLTGGGEPVSAIAQKCGYGSASTFGRAFRKHYGISPLEMRNSKKEGK